ncbi:NAD(P)H-hydrate dehydratase [Psychrobacter sp. 16-MNA-CIBAN-0192]|uniref:NAD(P)H-hydrate dehydratase n=1 Tax=Psychrobacter sp. 16-MNA-CIBAN-0192 TaxID=3140448 RepID=UPI003328BCD0
MQRYNHSTSSSSAATNAVALYSSEQIYAMEQAWFAQGYSSFALMQQAAWQMSQHIIKMYNSHVIDISHRNCYQQDNREQPPHAYIWVGNGNNGGDGWLVALYLQQAGWQAQVITVGQNDTESDEIVSEAEINEQIARESHLITISDTRKAQQMAINANCPYQRFEDTEITSANPSLSTSTSRLPYAEVYIDSLFGIGLDRKPIGIYQQAITSFNHFAKADKAWVVALDIPSGLVASTGQVYDQVAIQADVTLCLIARKFGLHTKDGMDHAGTVIDIPLIPYDSKVVPTAMLLTRARPIPARRQNSYKGSYGHVLIIGGNRMGGSQGMGGAAILSASSAMATGAGKITVACHHAFHGALLTSLPDAMTIDLHDKAGVKHLIQEASVIAIGMGLGRDKAAEILFVDYIRAAILCEKSIIIDADGLYHLATLHNNKNSLVSDLKKYAIEHEVCLTPHSGEAAKLLDTEVEAIEANRLVAISQCAQLYGGNWVLKGAGSLILEQSAVQSQLYVCGVGNAGMATAGMGDVLSGIIVGLLAQQDLVNEQRSLSQAVLIHGLAGDSLVRDAADCQVSHNEQQRTHFTIGQRGLQAQDMPVAIRHLMNKITVL